MCICFEVLSINLYELIKNNNFQVLWERLWVLLGGPRGLHYTWATGADVDLRVV